MISTLVVHRHIKTAGEILIQMCVCVYDYWMYTLSVVYKHFIIIP